MALAERPERSRRLGLPGWVSRLAVTLGSVAVTMLGLLLVTFLIGRVMPVDPVLADVVEDYDASALAEACGYTMRWPLERAVPDAIEQYEQMGGSSQAV